MMSKSSALKAAFPHTIPVLTGFAFLGIAYGILMSSKGYGAGWSVLLSLLAFAGSAQYVCVGLLTTAFDPLYALLLSTMVSARHLFYGISMLDKFSNTGKSKLYLIFGLCDETFSILHSAEPPEGVDKKKFMLWVTLLDHSYWVLGTLTGALLGYIIPFNLEGLEFALTALFVTIFLTQWKGKKNRKASLIGICSTLICLVLFGSSNFIIPSMILILLTLTIFRKQFENTEEDANAEL